MRREIFTCTYILIHTTSTPDWPRSHRIDWNSPNQIHEFTLSLSLSVCVCAVHRNAYTEAAFEHGADFSIQSQFVFINHLNRASKLTYHVIHTPSNIVHHTYHICFSPAVKSERLKRTGTQGRQTGRVMSCMVWCTDGSGTGFEYLALAPNRPPNIDA